MDRIIRICSLATLAALALPTAALAKPETGPTALRSYVMARTALHQGDDEAALVRFARVIALQPGDKQVAGRAMREAVRQGDMKLALRAAYQMGPAAELAPDALLLLISDRIKQGDMRGTAGMIDALEGNENFKFLGPLLRSWTSMSSKGTTSIQMLDAISKQSTGAFYVPEMKALQLMSLRREAEGLTLARSLALSSNSTPALRLSAATSLLKAGRKDEALGLIGSGGDELGGAQALIVKGGAGLPPIIKTPAQGIAQLYTRLANDLLTQRAPGFALMFARYAKLLDSSNPFVALTEAKAMAAAEREEQAEVALLALTADPIVSAQAKVARIEVLEELDRVAESLSLAKAMAEAPGASTLAWVRLADTQARTGNYADASASYERAIRMAETSGGAEPWLLWYSRGSALERGGMWTEARAALEKSVALAPNQPGPLNHLGYGMLERRQDLARALDLVRRAYELNPNSVEIQDSYGWALHLNGKTEEAIAILEKAVRADPTEPTLGDHLGDVYWSAGRKIDARYTWYAAQTVAEGDLQKRLAAKVDMGLTVKGTP